MEQTGQGPSYDELAVLVMVLKTQVDQLAAENAELKRRLGLNSRNSSKPPSADGLDKPPPKSMRGKSGRKPGKQPGSPGTALSQVAKPSRRVQHFPESCGGCSRRLSRSRQAGVAVRRQVFDVPEMKVSVTEHVLHALLAGAGT
ncbi:MAG: hypothetical protein JWL97_3475 [Gemmatimonadales bacterium]|nr:hypothetical protein [Gemmatimonadales bacterium]